MKISAAIVVSTLATLSAASAADADKILYKDLVAPILEAKCVSCHGEDKSKGKLRVDTLEHLMKGGSEGDTVLPGKASDSGLIFRIVLPLDDDEHMPPEDKPQLTEAEFDALTFWIKSGAKGDAKIGDLKPDEKEMAAIAAAFKDVAAQPVAHAADKPKDAPAELSDAEKKAITETIGRVDESGGSLMAIAQDTPALRFTALNVQKDFDDKGLDVLKPAVAHIQWADLARTQITDAGLKTVGSMKALTRLHLDGTSITDAGLDHLKGLENLQYLNLYGTQVTDAGLQKLAGLKKLEKVFVWQTKVTEAGAKKLSAALPNVSVNTGWSAASVAAVVPPAKPESKTEPKPTPKPAPKPTPKPEPKPAPKPAPTAKPAPTPPAKPLAGSIEESIATAKKTLADAKGKAASARTAATEAVKKAEAAQKAAVSADDKAKKAAEALALLEKAAAALK